MYTKVASLNFSGINVSPFEYHDGSEEKTQINTCFKRLLDSCELTTLQNGINISKIDLLFQKNRYTILYRSDVGVLRGKLVSKQQFETIWDLLYQENEGNVKCKNITDFEVENLKMFDRMVYEAFLEYVYGKINWEKIKEYDTTPFSSQLQKWHSKCYLSLSLKTQFVKDYILKRDLDILFLQQAEVQSITTNLPDGYASIDSSNSMIIFKQNHFLRDKAQNLFLNKFADKLNFNNDSAFIKFKDYLLISAHLSSKKVKSEQAQNLKQTLANILTDQPNLKIIIGIDANQYIEKIDNFSIFPETQMCFTTRKKRTDMQLQFCKAGIVVQDVKDHIITNLKITETAIQTISCENINEDLLPNQNHPFDHFAIYSKVINESEESLEFQNPIITVEKPNYDCKSISTCCTNNKRVNFAQSKAQDIEIPQIILTTCESIDNNTDKKFQMGSSRDFSNSSNRSKKSFLSINPHRKYLEAPLNSSRKQSTASQQQKCKNTFINSNHVFKFRQTNRSKSAHKSQIRNKPQNKIPLVYFTNSHERIFGNFKSDTSLNPTVQFKSHSKYYRH